MHAAQHFAGAGDGVFGAFDLDAVAARGDIDAEPVFDLDKVGVELAEQGPQHRGFIELDLDPRAARAVEAERRRIIGA